MVKNTLSYKYYIKDHLGNNRMVTDATGNVLQSNEYYPYGGLTGRSTNPEYQKFKYNGKEYDTMHGLNEYDYGARQYDPAIAQFTSMDPLCEKYYHISPYAYCGGNPLNRVDVNGDSIAVVINSDGARGFGHMAVFVQKNDKSWLYFSKNGHSSANNEGAKPKDVFESVDAFLQAHREYDNCIVIHDGKSKETEAIKIAKETINDEYSTFNSNCAQFVQNVLKAANVKNGTYTPSYIYTQADLMYNIANRIIPKYIYSNIIRQNNSNSNRFLTR